MTRMTKQICKCAVIDGATISPDADCRNCNGSGYTAIDPVAYAAECEKRGPLKIMDTDATNPDIEAVIRMPMMNVPSMQAITGPFVATSLTFGNAVSIDFATGAITRLSGFTTTDAAALAFWEAVERLAPTRRRDDEEHAAKHEY